MSGSLEGPLVKVRRATHHMMTLAAIVPPDENHARFNPLRHEFDPERLEYRFYVGELEPLDADLWATILGDFLFNARSALDQLVYELHVRRYRGNVPDEVAERTMFPILDQARTQRSGPHKGKPIPSSEWPWIKDLSVQQRTAIEFLQPYVTRKDNLVWLRRHLRLLNYLNRIDKHRRLHVVRHAAYGAVIPTFDPPDCGFVRTPGFGPVESYAEVDRWTFSRLPDNIAEQVGMQNRMVIDECIYEGGDMAPVMFTCIGIDQAVQRVIRRFARYFPPVTWPMFGWPELLPHSGF